MLVIRLHRWIWEMMFLRIMFLLIFLLMFPYLRVTRLPMMIHQPQIYLLSAVLVTMMYLLSMVTLKHLIYLP